MNDLIPNPQPPPGDGKLRAQPPTARVKRHAPISPIWLVPLAAAGVAVYLAVHAFIAHGPLITITFKTADGLTAHQTEVRHKAVKLGTVEEISLAQDMSRVVVRVRMEAQAKSLLTDQARFWVVRPRLSGGGLAGLQTGLETLVSGAYLAVDPGASRGRPTQSYTGLEEPPSVRSDDPGRVFQLKSGRLGSLGAGAPLFHRDVRVGEVLSYESGVAPGPVSIRVFVRAPFDSLIRDTTHFWNTSGLSLDMGPSGLHLEFRSLQSALSGGIAFETPAGAASAKLTDTKVFELYDSEAVSEADLFERVPCVTYLQSSLSGLAIGAPVQLRGVQMGIVTGQRLVFDDAGQLVARVTFDMQPTRALAVDPSRTARDLTTYILEQGVSVEVSSTNFVTGQKVLALEYTGAKAELRTEDGSLVVPGQGGGSLNDMASSLGSIAAKLNQIPFADIGKNVDRTLRSVNEIMNGPKLQDALKELSLTLQEVRRLAHDANAGMGPVLTRLPQLAEQMQQASQNLNAALGESGYGQSSDFQRNMTELVVQARDAARSIRLFVDYLDRHPEALIRGRSEKDKP